MRTTGAEQKPLGQPFILTHDRTPGGTGETVMVPARKLLFYPLSPSQETPVPGGSRAAPCWPGRGGRWIGFALAGVLHQERTEVQARQVAVPGGWFHDPERAVDNEVAAGVTGSAVVVDVDGVPDRAGVLKHQVAVGVVEAGTTTRREDDTVRL